MLLGIQNFHSEHREESWGSLINVRVVSGPAVDLGKENNLKNLLEKGQGDKHSSPNPEPEVGSTTTFQANDEEVCVSFPVWLPGSPHGESSDVGEDVSCEIGVIEHDQEPSHADWDVVENATSKAHAVGGQPRRLIVEHNPGHDRNSGHDERVSTVPGDGWSVVLLANQVIGSISGCGASIFSRL